MRYKGRPTGTVPKRTPDRPAHIMPSLAQRPHLRRATRHTTLLGLALACGLVAGCTDNQHPYTGTVEFRHDELPLYTADLFDELGLPLLPRQQPFEKTIDVSMVPNGEPDFGAYVDLEAAPPGSLTFSPIGDSCAQLQGVFRCRANEDGHATFLVSADSNFTGTARVKTVGKTPLDETAVTIRQAGLHADVEFSLNIAGGGSGAQKVAATYTSMACSLDADSGGTQFDKWPDAPRVIEAEVRAVQKLGASIADAPVFINVLNSEAFVTIDSTCQPPRSTRLRLPFDELGLATTFYFCFSDLGGSVSVKATSGDATSQSATFDVSPEPRLLRVITSKSSVSTGSVNPIVEISSYDAALNRLAFDVDVTSTDPTVLAVGQVTNSLSTDESIKLSVEGLAAGQAAIAVRPSLYDNPVCTSENITVEASP